MSFKKISYFEELIANDPENRETRDRFYRNYEALESYWRDRYIGENLISKFSQEFADFFWMKESIKDIARRFSSYPPVAAPKETLSLLKI